MTSSWSQFICLFIFICSISIMHTLCIYIYIHIYLTYATSWFLYFRLSSFGGRSTPPGRPGPPVMRCAWNTCRWTAGENPSWSSFGRTCKRSMQGCNWRLEGRVFLSEGQFLGLVIHSNTIVLVVLSFFIFWRKVGEIVRSDGFVAVAVVICFLACGGFV